MTSIWSIECEQPDEIYPSEGGGYINDWHATSRFHHKIRVYGGSNDCSLSWLVQELEMKAKKSRFQTESKAEGWVLDSLPYSLRRTKLSRGRTALLRLGTHLADGVPVVLLHRARGQAAAAAQQVPVQLHRAAHQLRPRQRGHGPATQSTTPRVTDGTETARHRQRARQHDLQKL